MAFKTITLDVEAYELLKRHKKAGQSFSQVVREHFGKIRTGRDLLAATQDLRISDETLDAIDRVIAARKRHPATRARFD